MCATKPIIEGGFAGIFGRIAALYFSEYGDQSDALARNCGEESQEWRRQSIRRKMRKDLG